MWKLATIVALGVVVTAACAASYRRRRVPTLWSVVATAACFAAFAVGAACELMGLHGTAECLLVIAGVVAVVSEAGAWGSRVGGAERGQGQDAPQSEDLSGEWPSRGP